jgi:hypothetical protein
MSIKAVCLASYYKLPTLLVPLFVWQLWSLLIEVFQYPRISCPFKPGLCRENLTNESESGPVIREAGHRCPSLAFYPSTPLRSAAGRL